MRLAPEQAADKRIVEKYWKIYWKGQLVEDELFYADESKLSLDKKKQALSMYISDQQLASLDTQNVHIFFSALKQGILPWGQQIVGLVEYPQKMTKLSDALGCPVMAGGTSVYHEPAATDKRDVWQYRNSVYLFDKQGQRQVYSKMHLVPFGEVCRIFKECSVALRFFARVYPRINAPASLRRFVGTF